MSFVDKGEGSITGCQVPGINKYPGTRLPGYFHPGSGMLRIVSVLVILVVV